MKHMFDILYRPTFVRQYRKLEPELQEEVKESIAKFRKNPRNPSLKAHKLMGHLQGSFSFSVNYKYRIVFEYWAKNQIALLAVGDHDIYR